MKNLSFSKIPCFFFLRFWHFWRENDVTNLAPNFGFCNMGYLMVLFERTFHKDLNTEKVLKYLYPLKRYIKFQNVVSFEWIDIFQMFSVLRSL